VLPRQAARLLEVVPPGRRVLVDVAPDAALLGRYRELGFDYYQLHFDLDIAVSELASWAGLVSPQRLWLAPRLNPRLHAFPQIVLEFATTILVDSWQRSAYGGSGRTGDWQRYLDWSTLYQHKTWVLAGGLAPENIAHAVAVAAPAVVDINSGVESQPGIKDPERLADLFARLQDLH
jgi:phosphoribosylanthranilate isomerase